jgi:WD40 repeat protein
LLALGSQDGTVLLWDVRDDVPRHRLSGFTGEVVSLVFHPHRPWLAAGERGGMRMYDVTTGALVLTGDGAPGGFSRDGRVLATSTTTTAAFQDLVVPEEVFRLHGHRTYVTRIVWARSSRRLASLDGAFEVNVWEVRHSRPLARLRAPVGSFGCANAAIALNDQGTRLAYASSGETAKALILDLATGLRGPWSLPTGFDRLACLGRDRFLLVREELDWHSGNRDVANAWPVHSVAYELNETGPRFLRTIRPAAPGDVRRFLNSNLSPSGRFYCWTGPRLPEGARRVEVRDVSTGELVWSLPAPAPRDEASLPWAKLSPDDRHLWVRLVDQHSRRYSLPHDRVGVPEEPPEAWLAGHWRLNREQRPDGGTEALLYPWGKAEPWLRLENDNGSDVGEPAFSPDGRFLAWTDDSGSLSVADLAALKEAVRTFEQ